MTENESTPDNGSMEGGQNKDSLSSKELLESRIKGLSKLGTEVRRDLAKYVHEQIDGTNVAVVHNKIVTLIVELEARHMNLETVKNTTDELEELIEKCEAWLIDKETNE